MEEGGRPVREGREDMREEIAGRLSRAVLDELNSEPIIVPVSQYKVCVCVCCSVCVCFVCRVR